MEIQSLMEAVCLSEYIGQYCDDLEFKDGEYWCLSPFTDEKTPSFSINDEQKTYYDFSSGHGGNIFTFIQRYHKVSFPKAVELAKEFAGITEDVYIQKNSEALLALKRFKPAPKKEKLPEYKVLPRDYMNRYDFNANHLKPWIDEGITINTLYKFGVRFDRSSNRIVFPLKNLDGEIINISGRTIDPEWKEKKLRKYTYTNPLGVLDIIYGLHENMDAIKQAGEIILFEGAKSVMKAREYGFENTGALLTSHLNVYQMKLLIKLSVDVVFALDKGVDVYEDKHILRMKPFAAISYIQDRWGLIEEKDSPVDKGKDVFIELYNKRRRLN